MILVVGPGRCGTSAVAQWLHVHGVNMGERFATGDEWNPEGYFEDGRLQHANQERYDKRIDLPVWRLMAKARIAEMREPWGFKDPLIAEFPNGWLELLPDAQIVRCHRQWEPMIDSWMRYGRLNRNQAVALCMRRLARLDAALKGRPVFDYECGVTPLEALGELLPVEAA